MGRKGRNHGKSSRRPKEDVYRSDALNKADMDNAAFTAYYAAQNIIPDQDEWSTFMEKMRCSLPVTFRVAGSREIAKELNAIIQDTYVPSLANTIFEGEPVLPPVQLPWYPDGLAWQFDVAKKVLRKQPEFKKFHSFIVFETEVGNISRQEAVSMLPPLFMDVQPHHRVLDMCAAPGSKTAQLLEALHANDTATSTSVPSGLLVANDSDNKRTHLLIHQALRLPSPAFVVTNLDASIYPSIKISKDEKLRYDRILADVPCSGDGTLRKNIGIWKKWTPADGNGLHSLQVRILERAMRLLAPGGRIVYSTCSLNPVENEAVVAAALNMFPEFELLDESARFPELLRRPGMSHWKPTADKQVVSDHFFGSYEDYVKSLESSGVPPRLIPSHWPPKNVADLNLERCMRVYPHLQNTGGFFIAVLERKGKAHHQAVAKELKRTASPFVTEAQPEAKKPRLEPTAPSTSTSATPQAVQDDDAEPPYHGGGTFKENPYNYLPPDDPVLQMCIERLHLLPTFPRGQVLVRNPEGAASRALYLTNDLVRAVVANNDYNRIRLTAAGTRVFIKQEGSRARELGEHGQFRILGEGLPVVLPFVDENWIMEAGLDELRILVEGYYPLCENFKQPFRGLIEAREGGCHVVRFKVANAGDVTLTRDILLPIWKSNVSMTLMIDKRAKSALSLRVFGSDISVAGQESKKRKKGAVEKGEVAVVNEEVEEEVEVQGDEEEGAEDADETEMKDE